MGFSAIFDGLYVDQLIQKKDGDTIIYPHGLLGRGYVLPAGEEPLFRRRMRLMMLVSITLGAAFAMFMLRIAQSDNPISLIDGAAIAGMAVLLFAGLRYYQGRLVAGLEPVAGARPTLRDWLRNARQARPTWTYWASIIFGLVMGLGSAAAIPLGASDGETSVVVSGAIMLVLSILAVIDGGIGITERRRTT